MKQPEDYYNISITEDAVKVEHPDHSPEQINWKDIIEIAVVTTDEGPMLPDHYLVLVGEKSGCAIPLGAPKYDAVYDTVSEYEGFDFREYIKSTTCAENARFEVWRKTTIFSTNPLELDIEYTTEEVIKAYKEFNKWGLRKYRNFIIGLCLVGIILGFIVGGESGFELLGTLVISLPIMLWIGNTIFSHAFFWKNTDYPGVWNIVIAEDYIQISTGTKELKYHWESFERLIVTQNFVLLTDKKDPIVILPKRILEKGSMTVSVIALLRRKIRG